MQDAIIVGKGPAGISAALYLKRAGLNVTVIGKGYGALEKAEKIENYYGLPQPVDGKQLVEIGIAQAEGLGIPVLTQEVLHIDAADHFTVKTNTGEHEALAVLLATGKSRVTVPIKGFEKLRGRGISFCAVCDGFFYRGKRLAVIGSGDYAASELHDLMNFSKDITLFTDGAPLTTDKLPEGLPVVTDKITEIEGEDRVQAIVTTAGRQEVDGIFVAIGTASAADFALKLGIAMEGGNITVDGDYMTNIEGLFAAGDCTGGFLQVAKAVSDGAHASTGMAKYIRSKKKAAAK